MLKKEHLGTKGFLPGPARHIIKTATTISKHVMIRRVKRQNGLQKNVSNLSRCFFIYPVTVNSQNQNHTYSYTDLLFAVMNYC
jgi:hypothetical protein